MANILWSKQIDNALCGELRQYLAGRLMFPQEKLQCIDSDIEVGISQYTQNTAEVPHYHVHANEYLYILQGDFYVFLWETDEEYHLTAGDFFHLPFGTKYASKATTGTRTLFIKEPGGNDKKTDFEVPQEVKEWLKAF